MKYYATIDELINSVKQEEISYRNLHTPIYIKNEDTLIKIPYKSIVKDYLDFFKNIVVTVRFMPKDSYKYNYKPKALSLEMYGTTELWSALLEINNKLSIIDFVFGDCKLFEPRKFKSLINEILILEKVIK